MIFMPFFFLAFSEGQNEKNLLPGNQQNYHYGAWNEKKEKVIFRNIWKPTDMLAGIKSRLSKGGLDFLYVEFEIYTLTFEGISSFRRVH